jgi:hypothetical protein
MNPEETDYERPVAYDANGQPLYAHPAKKHKPVPQVVHLSRAVEPIKPEISEAVQKRHDRSKRLYPFLNLSEGEYVIAAVRRHPIGLVIPLGLGTIVIALALSLLANYESFADYLSLSGPMADPDTVNVPIWLFTALITLGMFIIYYVYVNNKFFLTNESVIQEIQITLFSRLEQTVSLSNIEDASHTQHGILQTVFNYGSIRLSTEGDETTYRFTYVANPKKHIATLNNTVEAFKNGRPLDPTDD